MAKSHWIKAEDTNDLVLVARMVKKAASKLKIKASAKSKIK